MSIYPDQNATSPVHAPVIDAMPAFQQNPVANPSSLHGHGRNSPGLKWLGADSTLNDRETGSKAAWTRCPAAIRVGFGMENSLQDVDKPVSKLAGLVDRMPALVRRVAI